MAFLLLNRAKALHALNINMIRLLTQGLKVNSAFFEDLNYHFFLLKNAERDDRVKIVVLEGEGERAFCAGGDIRGTFMHPRNLYLTLFSRATTYQRCTIAWH